MTAEQEMQALWAAAEARRDAGQSPLRVIQPAYSLPPGDGEISARPWLTEAEVTRVHELWLDIQSAQAGLAAQARERLLQKHVLRRAANTHAAVFTKHEYRGWVCACGHHAETQYSRDVHARQAVRGVPA